MSRRKQFALAISLSFVVLSPAAGQEVPKTVGECVSTTIKEIGTRLQSRVGTAFQDVPGSGSAVRFNNGGYQVSYDTEPAIERSQPGDEVRMCLVSIPNNCPSGDYRGRVYRVTNLRTHQSWTLPNSEHTCGGA